MDGEIVTKIIELKMDMIASSTKYSITGTHEENDQTVLDAVVVLWIESVKDAKSLKEKYENFMKMDSLIRNSLLFDIAQSLANEPNGVFVGYAVKAYRRLVESDEYQQLAPKCGYQLPDEFGDEQNYLDGSLIKMVKFYYTFRDKIHSIYQDLAQKGVFFK